MPGYGAGAGAAGTRRDELAVVLLAGGARPRLAGAAGARAGAAAGGSGHGFRSAGSGGDGGAERQRPQPRRSPRAAHHGGGHYVEGGL